MICSPLKHIIWVINRRNLRLTDNVARMGEDKYIQGVGGETAWKTQI
jgi:hypothetical protein